MDALSVVLTALKGWRTYVSAIAALLFAISGCLQLVPTETAMAGAGAFFALAQIFQRAATADHALTLAELQQNLADATTVIKKLEAAATPPPTNPGNPAAAVDGLVQKALPPQLLQLFDPAAPESAPVASNPAA